MMPRFLRRLLDAVFPAPLLSLMLCGLWLLMQHTTDLAHVVLGAVLGVLIPIFTRGLRPLPVRLRHPLTMLTLALRVVYDTTVSNFQVVRFLLFPGQRRHAPAFVRIPLDVRDPNALAVLATICCITPGTAWGEISLDRSMVLLHVLEVDDPQKVIHHFKHCYERPLMKIFESA